MEFFIFILILILIVWSLIYRQINSSLAHKYKDVKEFIRKNPKHIRLRETVLKAGRKYYENSGYSPQERE